MQVRVGLRSIRLVQVRPPCICLRRCLCCVAAYAAYTASTDNSWTRFCACEFGERAAQHLFKPSCIPRHMLDLAVITTLRP